MSNETMNHSGDAGEVNNTNKFGALSSHNKLALGGAALLIATTAVVGAVSGSYYAQFTDSNVTTPGVVTGGTLTLNTGNVAYVVDKCEGVSSTKTLVKSGSGYNVTAQATNLWIKIPVNVSFPAGWKESQLTVAGSNIATIDSTDATLVSENPNPFDVSKAFFLKNGEQVTNITTGGSYDLYIPADVNLSSYAGHSWPAGSKIRVNNSNILIELKQVI